MKTRPLLLYRKAFCQIFDGVFITNPKTAKENISVIRLKPCERKQVLKELEQLGLAKRFPNYAHKKASLKATQ